MNVLEVVQRATNALGIPEPSTAVANTEDDVVQLVELLNQEGRSLSSRHNWQALTFEATFTTVATESQGTLASIIGATQGLRRVTEDTIWDRTQQQPIYGPDSPVTRQAKRALVLTGPYSQYSIQGNTLYFYPAPTAGHDCYFEYVSNMWCTDSTGATYRRNVAADSDLLLLDDEIMLAGLEWRWLRKKGLSYAEEFASYEALVAQAIARDGTKRTLNMANGAEKFRPGTFVSIGSWPLP